ncbi:hypothetical protein B7L88_gp167 [Rhizobium phage RHEph10]|uniref:hypothetical protein n=1 Tax=Rhizobium phage RHEph10 TaxID=1220717 RepID=UPI0002AB2C82|nr:hypothetical protein B7L88_gp167 [Rhizobium phage RHEph10]AGC36121.1 hypothetical protein RHEph10_gp078 [Rhizobium phage RHEph10]
MFLRKTILAGAAVVSVALLSSCRVDPQDAQRILADSGMKDIELKGGSWFGCSKGDTYNTEFVATGPTGRRVEGVICGGLLKAYTVRLY